LQRLDYVNNEVVVVDDASQDGTGRVACLLGATVVPVDTLPQGWTGKAHACWLGASRSTGEWLLFTDADTIHSPRSLSAAVSAAVASESGMVSFLCRQQCESLWERLVLPYAYALYFAGRLRINTSRRTAVANGQYILMRRAEYERIGGHRAIRASVIDDVALAQRAHACGVRVLLMRGEPWVAVRMYDGLASLSEGLSKNAVSFLAASPAFGVLTVAATLVFAGSVPGAVKAASYRQGMAAYAVPAIALLPWMRRFGVPVMYAWLLPAGGVYVPAHSPRFFAPHRFPARGAMEGPPVLAWPVGTEHGSCLISQQEVASSIWAAAFGFGTRLLESRYETYGHDLSFEYIERARRTMCRVDVHLRTGG